MPHCPSQTKKIKIEFLWTKTYLTHSSVTWPLLYLPVTLPFNNAFTRWKQKRAISSCCSSFEITQGQVRCHMTLRCSKFVDYIPQYAHGLWITILFGRYIYAGTVLVIPRKPALFELVKKTGGQAVSTISRHTEGNTFRHPKHLLPESQTLFKFPLRFTTNFENRSTT